MGLSSLAIFNVKWSTASDRLYVIVNNRFLGIRCFLFTFCYHKNTSSVAPRATQWLCSDFFLILLPGMSMDTKQLLGWNIQRWFVLLFETSNIFWTSVCYFKIFFFSVYQRFLLAIVFDLQCVNVHTVWNRSFAKSRAVIIPIQGEGFFLFAFSSIIKY